MTSKKSFNLAEAALQIARDEYPDLEPQKYLNLLDSFASEVRSRLTSQVKEDQIIQELNHYLFDELGLAGNVEDYYDPRNSFLNDVLDRKLGVPILLSIIYIEVGKQLGLSISGVNFPGHFLVRAQVGENFHIIDPFSKGVAMEHSELDDLLISIFGDDAPTIEQEPLLLRTASDADILVRILSNLKGIYLHHGDIPRLLTVMDRIISIAPDSPIELRDRGKIYEEVGYNRQALSDYRRYLELVPDAHDGDTIRLAISKLQNMAEYLH